MLDKGYITEEQYEQEKERLEAEMEILDKMLDKGLITLEMYDAKQFGL